MCACLSNLVKEGRKVDFLIRSQKRESSGRMDMYSTFSFLLCRVLYSGDYNLGKEDVESVEGLKEDTEGLLHYLRRHIKSI